MARASSWFRVEVSMRVYNECRICEEDHSSRPCRMFVGFVMITACEVNMSNFDSR